MVRAWHAVVIAGLLEVTGCHHHAPQSQLTAKEAVRRVAMDSAAVERLCAQPDSVRAGVADCVLKNQARPADRQFEGPPPKPPR